MYKFNYDGDGGVTVDVTTNGKTMAKGSKKKQQVSHPNETTIALCLHSPSRSCCK